MKKRTIRAVITQEMYDKIVNTMIEKGCFTVTEYIRDLIRRDLDVIET